MKCCFQTFMQKTTDSAVSDKLLINNYKKHYASKFTNHKTRA